MKKNLTIIVLSVLLELSAFSQMASSSFFSEMKSINPAVINGRPYGQYSAFYGKETVKKDQVISEVGNENSTTKIDIDTLSFFRGGKGGGFLTTEFTFLKNNGTRVITVTAPSIDDTTISNAIKFSHLELGIGIGRFVGISIGRQSYDFESKFTFSLSGTDFSEDKKKEITSTLLKVGGVLPFGDLRFSTYYESVSQDIDTKEFLVLSGYEEKTSTDSNAALGLALGYVTKAIHLELGYEKGMSGASGTRISGTAEITFWKIALGYTGRSYKDGFQDNDKLVYNQLIYLEASDKARLEHIFNFSYGASGGFSIGGSASLSEVETEEKNPLTSDALGKLPTKVKSMSYSLKVGYVF